MHRSARGGIDPVNHEHNECRPDEHAGHEPPLPEEYERRGAGHGTAHGTSPPASRRVTGIAACDPALHDARKAATLAILAGVTQALPVCAWRRRTVLRRIDHARQDAVCKLCRSNPALRQQLPRCAGPPTWPRAINADAGRCAQTGGGGYMDDATIMTFGHTRYDCGARRERDPRVDREQNLPIVQSRLSDPARPESADRIHERIDTAKPIDGGPPTAARASAAWARSRPPICRAPARTCRQ